MENLEEVVEGSNKDLSQIVKGKRTKRHRPQSPIPFNITSNSSTSGDHVIHEEVTINNNDNNSDQAENTTEEEEEMAKCLILMSQGGYQRQKIMESRPNKFDLFNDDMVLYQSKFNSKRYVETTNAKTGTYVYECKTCNRIFPSFQALGGHRASHKKPKPLTIEPKKPFYYFSDQEEPSPTTYNKNNLNKLSPLSPLSFQFSNIHMESPNNKSSPRVHTCSYCGAEFNSGQALGGHMRRHRGGANTTLCLSPLTQPISFEESVKKPRNNGLSLDLNLPAPSEDQSQISKQHEHEQTALVLSTTPQLIDCHY